MSLNREDKQSEMAISTLFAFIQPQKHCLVHLFENSLRAAEFWDMASREEVKQLQQIKQMGIKNVGEPPKQDRIVH